LPYKDLIVRKAYFKKYHKEHDNLIQRKRRTKHKRMLDRIKKESGCSHCEFNGNPVALQFHHINPEDKLFTVSKILTRPILTILRETEKCIVLCSNCHAVEEQRLNLNALY
jgi:hypothetical protein